MHRVPRWWVVVAGLALGCSDGVATPSGSDADVDASIDGGADAGTLVVDPIADQVAIPGTDLGPLPIVVSGTDAPTVTVSSTSLGTPEPTSLPAEVFVLGGSGASRTLTITGLAPEHAGRYRITIDVVDGSASGTLDFELRVNAPPALAFVADTGTVAGFGLPPFLVSVYDDGLAPETLVLTASSSDPSFLPNAGIALSPIVGGDGGSGAFTVTLTLAHGDPGSTEVTLTATDPEGATDERTFSVLVTETASNGVELVSRTGTLPATGGDQPSEAPTVSGDGRIVVFTSQAGNLAGGGASAGDLFVRDRLAGTTTRLGIPGKSGGAAITSDGRFVAFTSTSASLAGGDANGAPDVFVYDRMLTTFERISVASDETLADAGSSVDPSYVGAPFRRVAISDDGRFVAFESDASNLVPDDTNGVTDVFVRDRMLGTTSRVSESTSGAQADGPSTRLAMSGDGSVVAFTSSATNLVDGAVETDAHDDVYVRAASAVVRVSSSGGVGGAAPGNAASRSPSLSADGRFLVYTSSATDLLAAIEFYGKEDLYLLDRSTGATTRWNFDRAGLSQGHCYDPSISADGGRIAFRSDALVPGFENGFLNGYVLDVGSQSFSFVGASLVGTAPSGGTGYAISLAAGGGVVVFQSAATNLFPGDTNGAIDVFAQSIP